MPGLSLGLGVGLTTGRRRGGTSPSNPITGTGPVLAALTDGDTLSSAVTWGSYLPGGATADRQMRVNGGAWVAYVGGTVVAEGEVWEVREVVSYGVWTSVFASEAQEVAEAPAPTLPVIVSPGSIDAQPLVGQAVLVTEPEVTGATSAAYQWYDGDPAGSGAPISGWTGAAPTPTATQYALSAPIWRRATYTNDAGSIVEDLQAPARVGAVYSDDFSAYTVGNTFTQLDALYNQIAGSGFGVNVISDMAAPSGKSAQLHISTSNLRGMWRADAQAFGSAQAASTERTQALFVFRHIGGNIGRYLLRFVNPALSWVGPGVAVINGSARLQIDGEDPNTAAGTALANLTPGTVYCLRAEQSGDQIRAKVWPLAEAEQSEWSSRTCTTSITPPAPFMGVRFASPYPATQCEMQYWSAGYNTDAPFWSGFVPPVAVSTDPMNYSASGSATEFEQNDGMVVWTFEDM